MPAAAANKGPLGPASAVIVVAAKAPRPGTVKTRLLPALSPEAAASLAGAFLEDTLQTAATAAASLRADLVLALDGAPALLPPSLLPLSVSVIAQAGNTLGERLETMMGAAGLSVGGDRRVCVIGGDAPHLPAAFLIEAFGRLATADVVLGPADDGGYYLIALSRPAPTLFADIPWSGPDVLAATRVRAAAAGLRLALLPPWYDVDTPHDLRRMGGDLACGVAHAPATRRALANLSV